MTIFHLHPNNTPPAIIRSEEEHDRKECVALATRADGSNREWADWANKHSYTNATLAQWTGWSKSKVTYLRMWAANGFLGSPFDRNNQPRSRSGQEPDQEPLKTKDNFTDTPKPDEDEDEDGFGGVEDPAAIVSNVLDSISGAKSLFEAWRKTFTASAFDREQKAQLYNAINLLIAKLRKVQSTLDTKGRGDG